MALCEWRSGERDRRHRDANGVAVGSAVARHQHDAKVDEQAALGGALERIDTTTGSKGSSDGSFVTEGLFNVPGWWAVSR